MRQCEYKAKHEGRIFAKIGTFYPSSKTCSACGHKLKDLSLATRGWDDRLALVTLRAEACGDM